ncbi:MAG: hypothetical protein R3247_06380 [Rhodothermales bacterium]|nr:hypothetical protein [Rhodothermales bacterium]
MLHASALPFVVRRTHQVISGNEVTSTREVLHGLLHLDGDRLRVQWRTTREISQYGREVRTDRELAPLREVSIPLSGLAGARVRRRWRRWRFVEGVVLTAADLRAFDALAAEADAPGLVLEHPAEVMLDVRRADRALAREFVSELRLAISELRLASYEEPAPLLAPEDPLLAPGDAAPSCAQGEHSAARLPGRSGRPGS